MGEVDGVGLGVGVPEDRASETPGVPLGVGETDKFAAGESKAVLLRLHPEKLNAPKSDAVMKNSAVFICKAP